jgi:hypothetical protein
VRSPDKRAARVVAGGDAGLSKAEIIMSGVSAAGYNRDSHKTLSGAQQ